jgi:hypothetical protein
MSNANEQRPRCNSSSSSSSSSSISSSDYVAQPPPKRQKVVTGGGKTMPPTRRKKKKVAPKIDTKASIVDEDEDKLCSGDIRKRTGQIFRKLLRFAQPRFRGSTSYQLGNWVQLGTTVSLPEEIQARVDAQYPSMRCEVSSAFTESDYTSFTPDEEKLYISTGCVCLRVLIFRGTKSNSSGTVHAAFYPLTPQFIHETEASRSRQAAEDAQEEAELAEELAAHKLENPEEGEEGEEEEDGDQKEAGVGNVQDNSEASADADADADAVTDIDAVA